MGVPTDMSRRLKIKDMMKNGEMKPTEDLAKEFNVNPRTIRRDLQYLRETESDWLEDVADNQIVSMFHEIWNGYYRDIGELSSLIEDNSMTPKARMVHANLVKMRSDLRKDQLLMLTKGPIMWDIDRLLKSGKVLNVKKSYSKAIYGELQKNTHMTPEEIPQAYTPPTIDNDSGTNEIT